MALRIVCYVVVAWMLLAASLPDPGAPWRVDSRACHAEQEKLAVAVGMYLADHPETSPSLTPGLLLELRDRGYLARIPEDPGEGPGSALNYFLTALSATRVSCRVHGPARLTLAAGHRAPRPAREKLLADYEAYWAEAEFQRRQTYRAWYEPAAFVTLLAAQCPAAVLITELLAALFLLLRGCSFLAELHRDLRAVLDPPARAERRRG